MKTEHWRKHETQYLDFSFAYIFSLALSDGHYINKLVWGWNFVMAYFFGSVQIQLFFKCYYKNEVSVLQRNLQMKLQNVKENGIRSRNVSLLKNYNYYLKRD